MCHIPLSSATYRRYPSLLCWVGVVDYCLLVVAALSINLGIRKYYP